MNQSHIQHLYHRAGFGISIKELQKFKKQSTKKLARKLIQDAQRYEPLKVVPDGFPSLEKLKKMSKFERKFVAKPLRKAIKTLNKTWIDRMATTDAVLREKMTFFWHDHFANKLNGVYVTQQQNNTLRKHAMGKFGDLLGAISRDPGMLRNLNNQQNRKASPNENFAREVLELFTLGRGHYTETDIKEAARAFTGWGFDKEGAFKFRKGQHDFGTKTFMGQTGNFDGDDILRIVLNNKQTAIYLTEKLYRFLVGPQPDENVVMVWADEFYHSDYDISALLERIFTSDHFYSEKVIGSRIKSPVEYLVSIMRMLNLRFEEGETTLFLQRVLGQTLFFPPNVSGWPDGRAWIDSSSIIARLKIPQALIMQEYLEVRSKAAFAGNEDLGMGKKTNLDRKVRATIDWKPILTYVKSMSDEKAIEALSGYFLQTKSEYLTTDMLKNHVFGQDRETQVKVLVMRIMGTPEFQMC